MKKYWLYILGGLIIILLGVWGYMMFWHDPNTNSEGLFANLNWFGNDNTEPIPLPSAVDTTTGTPTVNVGQNRLQQLTTRAVAGYQTITVDDTNFMYYVEAGVGHIFRINLSTGEETRISNTTIAQTYETAFSPDGQFIAIRSDITRRNEVTLGSIKDGTYTGGIINANVLDFSFTSDGYFLYSTLAANNTDTLIQARNLSTNSERTLYTIPLRSITINFPVISTGKVSFYPKATKELSGSLYILNSNGRMERLPGSGLGFMGMMNQKYIFSTRVEDDIVIAQTYNIETEEATPTIIPTLPDKCVFLADNAEELVCGWQDFTQTLPNFPDNWFKGALTFNDAIWLINIPQKRATPLIYPSLTLGRSLDIIEPTVNSGTPSPMLYFINKYDKTLWSFAL